MFRHLLLILAASAALAIYESARQPDGKFHISFFDVGQGDSILLQGPSGTSILVDGGPDLSLLEHLGRSLPFFQRTIDLLILTHPDLDHLAGLSEILRRYRVSAVILTGVWHDRARYKDFLHEILRQNTPVILPDPTKDIVLRDGVVLDFIWPKQTTYGTEDNHMNNSSVVLRVLYGNKSILLTGDIERESENEILLSGADIRADILVVPHHGSRTSSSTGFLLAVQPEIAVISAGKDNPYGHPHPEIVRRYWNLGIKVESTAEKGTITYIW